MEQIRLTAQNRYSPPCVYVLCLCTAFSDRPTKSIMKVVHRHGQSGTCGHPGCYPKLEIGNQRLEHTNHVESAPERKNNDTVHGHHINSSSKNAPLHSPRLAGQSLRRRPWRTIASSICVPRARRAWGAATYPRLAASKKLVGYPVGVGLHFHKRRSL